MTTRGQALVESVLFFCTLWILVAATVAFTKWFMTHQKLLIAAREGAMLYSNGRMEPSEVRQRVTQFLVTGHPALESSFIEIYVGRANGFQSVVYRLDEVRVRYRSSSSSLFHYFDPNMEEKCVIKHAPPYGLPVGNWMGPAVPW